MSNDNDVAQVIDEIIELLLIRPTARGELYSRFADRRRAYDDAIGSLRVLGLITRDKVISLTDVGRRIAEGAFGMSSKDVLEAFQVYRQSGARSSSEHHEDRLPSVEAIHRNATNVGKRDTRALVTIRENAVNLQYDTSRPETRFALTMYIAAIDSEFERRSHDPFNEEWFRWPDTDAPGGDGSVAGVAMLNEGMLSTLGYRVGLQNGLASPARLQVLARVFEKPLPPLFAPDYMRKWGEKSSAHRLKTLAYTIAQFAKNLKRRHDDRMDVAIEEYEADLHWLYDTYYVGKFRFDWPSTSVW